MDELFRKAGEGYPLKIDTDEWDKISPLITETFLPKLANKKNSLRKYSLLIFLLLAFFLFGTLTSRYIWTNDTTINGKPTNKKQSIDKILTEDKQTKSITSRQLVTQEKDITNRQVSNKKRASVATFILPDHKKILARETGVNLHNNNNAAKSEIDQYLKHIQNIADLRTDKNDSQNEIILKKNNAIQINKLVISLLKATGAKIPANTANTTKSNKTKNIKDNLPRKKLYVGALAGLSLNRVKNQGLQKSGFDVGLMAGYQFTHQFSIETGLLFEQKHYYTSGEYFNPSKIASAMPVGMKVLSLKGKFSVFELPLTFKYNWPSKNKNGHFYTTAGISTYLMSKEYNQYQTLLNGTQNDMTGIYRNQSIYSAALINISVGYEKNIGKSTLLRIDPYVQFPIKGIGIGAIPVTTIGIHLGVFRFTR